MIRIIRATNIPATSHGRWSTDGCTGRSTLSFLYFFDVMYYKSTEASFINEKSFFSEALKIVDQSLIYSLGLFDVAADDFIEILLFIICMVISELP